MNFFKHLKHISEIKLIRLVFILVLFFEVLSYTSYFYQPVNALVFLMIIFFAFILSLKDLKYGVFFVLTELGIGSKGYLFSVSLGSIAISIRLGIFLAVFLAFLIYLIRKRDFSWLKNPLFRWYAVLLVFIGWGVISGLINGNNPTDIFFDANGYLFFGLFPIFLVAIRDLDQVKQSWSVIIGSLMALATKTIILLFFFSHHISWVVPSLYRWSRLTQVAEIAEMGSGVYRIFFQSHIWAVIVFFLASVFTFLLVEEKGIKFKDNKSLPALIFISTLMIFISYSRSFWAALVVVILIMLAVFIWQKSTKKTLGQAILLFAANFILVLGFTYGIVNFPWPQADGIALGSLIEERSDDLSKEPASVSRFKLLGPLMSEVKSDFIQGSGFGTKVTYQTEDLRYIDMHDTNEYSTYVFEWAYLDTITEIGFLGLVAYLIFLGTVFKRGIELIRSTTDTYKKSFVLGLLLGLAALMIVHIFTPYLNHPLGIGILIFCITVIAVISRQPRSSPNIESESHLHGSA